MIDYESYIRTLDQRREARAGVIQCSECPNYEQAGRFTEQELIADGWLLEPVVYCPRCGPDDQKES